MNMIALEIELALERAGIARPTVRTVLSPAWTTDWMSEDGRDKLREYGIAPPQAQRRAARCSARSRSPARNAVRTTPSCWPNSARPPARRCGAARPAASRSIISSVIERSCPHDTALPPLTVNDVRREAADAVSMAFAIPTELAGDYGFDARPVSDLARDLDGEDMRRSYSICSGPDDGELRIAVKQVDGGAFSNWAADELRAGDELDVMTPTGRFGVAHAPGDGRIHVGFAAGTGITPILSIIRGVLAREPNSRFFLFYGNRSTRRHAVPRSAGRVEGPLHAAAFAVPRALARGAGHSDPEWPARRREGAPVAAPLVPAAASITPSSADRRA